MFTDLLTYLLVVRGAAEHRYVKRRTSRIASRLGPLANSLCAAAVLVPLVREPTLRASLSGTFLQTLPELVTPLKGHFHTPSIAFRHLPPSSA